jgi:DNA-binding transcriptional regulator YdaS (Cro superfamily)
MNLIDRFKASRLAGVPLVAIITPDGAALVDRLRAGLNGTQTAPPLVTWDCVRALRGINRPGQELIAALVEPPEPGGFAPPPGAALTDALSILDGATVPLVACILLAHKTTESTEAIQAILNCRDTFKASGKTLVLLQPSGRLPIELSNDVLSIDDPLPEREEVAQIITREHENASSAPCFKIEPYTPDALAAATDALVGLPRFTIEQSAALCLTSYQKIDPAELWEQKRAALSQIPGLSMDSGLKTFETIGGLMTARKFGHRVMTGKLQPALIARIDEIEKAIAGVGTDLSGVTTAQVGTMLSAFEDNGWSGIIAAGPPGSGKTEFSKCLGATYGRRTLTLDLGAAKGSLVGQSEAQIRQMVQTIVAIAGRRCFFVASCNKLEVLPPELRRRFKHGIWFFDLPSSEERDAIWVIQLTAYGLPLDSPRPSCDGWTGAEIRNACELAYSLDITPAEAAEYIVPIVTSDPDSIDRLRRAAAGKWLSASYAGPYRLPVPATDSPTKASPSRRYSES